MSHKEPMIGSHIVRADKVCRYLDQRSIKGIVPRAAMVMACLDRIPVTPGCFPEETTEPVTCPECLKAAKRATK